MICFQHLESSGKPFFFKPRLMKTFIIMLTFLGIMTVVVGYVKQTKSCPPPQIEYRYVPRTFKEDQENPVKISELFNSMFTEPTPWLRDIGSSVPKNSEINRYYISQGGTFDFP
jgi:hypothetical protein